MQVLWPEENFERKKYLNLFYLALHIKMEPLASRPFLNEWMKMRMSSFKHSLPLSLVSRVVCSGIGRTAWEDFKVNHPCRILVSWNIHLSFISTCIACGGKSGPHIRWKMMGLSFLGTCISGNHVDCQD